MIPLPWSMMSDATPKKRATLAVKPAPATLAQAPKAAKPAPATRAPAPKAAKPAPKAATKAEPKPKAAPKAEPKPVKTAAAKPATKAAPKAEKPAPQAAPQAEKPAPKAAPEAAKPAPKAAAKAEPKLKAAPKAEPKPKASPKAEPKPKAAPKAPEAAKPAPKAAAKAEPAAKPEATTSPPTKLLLVTGATGFLGRHVVAAAKGAGWRVRVLARATSNLGPIAGLYDEVHTGDVTDAASLRGSCEGVTAVVHCACAVASTFDAGRAADAAFMAVNAEGTANLADEVLKVPGLRFVQVSSTAAMGAPQTAVVGPDSPCQPKTPYQRSKRAAELLLLERAERGLNVVIVRTCVIAGPGKERSELLKMFKLVKAGLFPFLGNNLDIQKPLIDVDDVVQALLLATERGTGGGIYLVTSGGRHTMREILEVAQSLTGGPRTHVAIPVAAARLAARAFTQASKFLPDWNVPITDERIDLFLADRQIDISRAERELGYAPKHQSVEEMLGATYRYYRQRGMI
ncbi:MAG: NAD-dependent epimerase/dehydratase family protein [Deltaproteobacteria bacterium]|nr:NAD-dependent epimerase/dehydratase family protein [Deltaproteobacteria bacterium]